MTKKHFIADDKTLMSEWDFDENKSLQPEKLTRGSNKRASWICLKCNHKWKTAIHHRASRGTGCPNCQYSKRKKYSNKNLTITNPEIAENWHPINNDNLTPDLFLRGSRFKVFWQCHKCMYEWSQSIKGYNGCAKCKKVSKLKENNLETNYPALIKEWNYFKNSNLKPSKISYSSSAKVWWNCSTCGFEWEAKVSNRSVLGRGCPACANKVVVEGENDLKTTHPELAGEWHFKKNVNLKPNQTTYGSGQKVWWICPLGHEYKASILHRAHGTNCSKCNSGRQTSFAEQAVYYYVNKLYPDAKNRFTAAFLGRMELDIYIPSIKYAIEYDGEAWHKKGAIKREQNKYNICNKNGIKLIRLREKMPNIGSNIADYMFSTDKLYEPKNLEKMLVEILKRINFSGSWMIGCPIDVNIERDRYEIQKYRTKLKTDSLANKFPKIAKEWHVEKNGRLTPNMFKPRSDQKVWWKCLDCENEYEATIGHRTFGTGCPNCAIEKVTKIKRKAVNMLDPVTGEVLSTFISISDASRKMNINSSNISMVCKGQRPKAGGYFWEYVGKD